MNLKEIKQLLDMIENSGVTDFEWNEDGHSIVIRKQREVVSVGAPAISYAAPTVSVSHSPAVGSDAPVAPAEDFLEIKSPMVGTFYAAPSPNDPDFVKVGDRVEVGQVVCIVEAMKLMNEIKADVAGVIAEVCIENGNPVEFGKPLYKLRKA